MHCHLPALRLHPTLILSPQPETGLGLRVLGFRVSGLGLQAVLGFRVSGLGLQAVLGFRVSGLGV